MENIITYKDFIATVKFIDQTLYGKIEGINDLVTFEGETVGGFIQAFRDAVDDYIELCKEVGKDPMKSYKGSFNVRIDPEMHRRAALAATTEHISLNQFIQQAIEKVLEDEKYKSVYDDKIY